jgi:hypothetical protein
VPCEFVGDRPDYQQLRRAVRGFLRGVFDSVELYNLCVRWGLGCDVSRVFVGRMVGRV